MALQAKSYHSANRLFDFKSVSTVESKKYLQWKLCCNIERYQAEIEFCLQDSIENIKTVERLNEKIKALQVDEQTTKEKER